MVADAFMYMKRFLSLRPRSVNRLLLVVAFLVALPVHANPAFADHPETRMEPICLVDGSAEKLLETTPLPGLIGQGNELDRDYSRAGHFAGVPCISHLVFNGFAFKANAPPV